MTTRKDQSIDATLNGRYIAAGTTQWNDARRDIIGSRKTTSFGHNLSGLGKGDVGGPFYTENTSISVTSDTIDAIGAGGKRYQGEIIPQYFGGWPVFTSASDFWSLAGMGTTAIARSLPTNPSAGTAAFVGELREGLPHIIGSGLLKERTRYLKGSGSEYLNVEFGWKPMMADLRKFARSVKSQNKVLDQYVRDSGRNIRRSYEFPDVSSVVSNSVGWHPFTANSDQLDVYQARNGVVSQSTTSTRKRWFSGAFSYVVPDQHGSAIDKLRSYEAQANKLLGTRLTPDVIWQLTPWSWAVDWFSNAGDVIRNVSSFQFDGLNLRYGYIMEHSSVSLLQSWSGEVNSPGGWTPAFCAATWSMETKVRYGATPFGFNVDWSGMTPRQLAISAALGATKHPSL